MPLRDDPIVPLWTTRDGSSVRLYLGDVRAVLRRLPASSVQCIVTSPPYWGLRDYGTASWEGGSAECGHRGQPLVSSGGTSMLGSHDGRGGNKRPNATMPIRGGVCPCGARRVDAQIGSEARPDCLGWARGENCAAKDWAAGCHVCRMVLVFRELRRVLRDDGTCWLNYGDSYASGVGESGRNDLARKFGQNTLKDQPTVRADRRNNQKANLPSGNLVGVPWRVALALQADGWILRQDIVWAKPSPMPESVRNRCTKAHEYVFLLAKRMGYFYDAEAIKEKALQPEGDAKRTGQSKYEQAGFNGIYADTPTSGLGTNQGASHRNKRSVWNVSSQGYEGAHFATFPEKLIEPMILAGTSAKGACAKCGVPWRRVLSDASGGSIGQGAWVGPLTSQERDERGNFKTLSSKGYQPGKTIGWEPTCECHGKFVESREAVKVKRRTDKGVDPYNRDHSLTPNRNGKDSCSLDPGVETVEVEDEQTVRRYVSDLPLDEHPVCPCVVLDPFIGSGTTCVVSLQHGRWSWGIDLSEKYLRANAIPRIEGQLLSTPASRALLPRRDEPAEMLGEE